MKKNYLLIALSCLLLIQVAYLLNTVSAQRKEVKIPNTEQTAPLPERKPPVLTDDSHKNENTAPKIEELTMETNPSAEYYAINPDYVGWLKIEETVIDYPVVRGKDNEQYLNHNFYRENDPLGSIFMDHRNIGMGMDRHTILYGHYSRYGQMFTDLEKYLSEEFLKENPTFTFKDSFTEKKYEIFSIHYGEAESRFLDIEFSGNEYSQFIDLLKSESIFPSEVPVSETDSIFTLITCNYIVKNGRLFLHAVEVPE
ncbi:MAG: class B sortase [Pisciglobus halotolerans]|nr:class B sortase [Pisciglobus halotolerans]